MFPRLRPFVSISLSLAHARAHTHTGQTLTARAANVGYRWARSLARRLAAASEMVSLAVSGLASARTAQDKTFSAAKVGYGWARTLAGGDRQLLSSDTVS